MKLDGRIIITYKYNKKGFRIEAVTDFMGGEYNYTDTYKYNKKGDLIKSTFKDTNDGSSLSLSVNGTPVETVSVTDHIATFTARSFSAGDVLTVSGTDANDTLTFN